MSSEDDSMTLGEVRAELHRELMNFARRPTRDPEQFDGLAERVLHYQARAIPSYGRLVEMLGADLGDWRTAPLVPTELFREVDLCSLPVGEHDKIFRTSGTTQGKRGFRRVPDLSIYRTAMSAPFVEGVLGGDATLLRWISLIPGDDVLGDSSLSYMVRELSEVVAAQTYWIMEKDGLRLDEARIALGEGYGAGDAPVLVLTTAFALADLLERARWFPRLPKGSIVMLTGGFKGRSENLSEAELLVKLQQMFGVPPERVMPEYGMTELTSQAYGRPLAPMPSLKFRVVHPETGAALPPGETGLVGCFDLLNLDNVSSILTSDLGALDAEGRLTLHGRMPGAMPRGCSLSAEEILRKP